MGITTSQQLQNYYDLFRDTEVTYTKDILRTLAIDPRQIYIKCNGGQWPCIINSTSFQMAKIIVGTKGGAFAQISRKDPPSVSLRFYFLQQHDQPISFFITGRVSEISKYMNSNDLAVVTINFTQRPPDDLIEKVGRMLEANSNAIRRKEERITITDDSKRRLGLSKDQTIIFIENVPRRCILRDISFSGAKVILVGIEKFVREKNIVLRIHFEDPDEIISLEGRVVTTSPVENKPEIIYACLQFNENSVPTSYKIRINNYLTTIRKTILKVAQQQQQNSTQTIEKPESPKVEQTAQTQSTESSLEENSIEIPSAENQTTENSTKIESSNSAENPISQNSAEQISEQSLPDLNIDNIDFTSEKKDEQIKS